MNWLARLFHTCAWPQISDEPAPGDRRTCLKCGTVWEWSWASDVIEPTIMQPVDMGDYEWKKVERGRHRQR